jgi:dienelactone hydrolase
MRAYTALRSVVALALLAGGPLGAPAARAEVVARHGASYLEKCRDQCVLHLKGTYREMGLAHGRLLRQAVAEDAEAFLDHWCVGGGREKAEALRAIYRKFEPFLPERYKEELAGLAEGSGVPLEKLQLLHAIPERFHCTGTAAFGPATVDGKLYHTRSLDYALDIGNGKRAQENALLVVYEPPDGHAYCVVGWAGFIGCVTGMNVRGISIGEMGSPSQDEDFAGVPMIFLLREALRRAGTLEEALAVFRQGPRTCGYNFIVADGKVPDARALEATRTHLMEFGPCDPAENVGGHCPLPHCVRRCNHFVGPATARTQRGERDAKDANPASWVAYELLGFWLREQSGRIDARRMIGLLRLYPPGHPCLHQAVFCPGDLDLWVSHAADPRRVKAAGAQNQPFYRYNLKKLLAGEPAEAGLAVDYKDKPRDRPDPVVEGKVAFRPVGDESKVPEPYRLEPHEFPYRMQLLHDCEGMGFEVHDVRFPSPVRSKYEENNTVYAELYLPKGAKAAGAAGPNGARAVPGVIVLDILGGDQTLGRMQATLLAQHNIAALFVQMAYYGPRRPAGKSVHLLMPDIEHSVEATRQTVLDVRRAAAWLASRPEIDARRLGVLGTSLGSFMGALAAEMDPRLNRVALLLGGGGLVDAFYDHPKAWLIRKAWELFGGSREKLQQRIALADPLTCAANLKDRKLIMFGAKRDEIVPPAATERLWKAAGEPPIVWYDATHTGAVLYIAPALKLVLEHFGAP